MIDSGFMAQWYGKLVVLARFLACAIDLVDVRDGSVRPPVCPSGAAIHGLPCAIAADVSVVLEQPGRPELPKHACGHPLLEAVTEPRSSMRRRSIISSSATA